ncbi:MAG TPA: VOC family protein [Solirubrobacteraceae bacterium]|nr:VOC family protein [Solirubrobacteraceae bacterium]
MLHHVGVEVSDLARSARFYDAVLQRLGARRLFEAERAIAWGVNDPGFWIAQRDRGPRPGWGHVAFAASGRAAVDAAYEAALAAGGRSDGPPGPRPRYGPRYYAAYVLDPDGLRVELVSGGR